MTASLTTCVRPIRAGAPGITGHAGVTGPERPETPELLDLARRPWTLRIGATTVAVRPASVRDLPGVAALHRRCSARSLLDRYHRGGRPPTAAVLDAELRNPDGVVAFTADGTVVATGSIRRDTGHGPTCAELSLLVEDTWQRRGLGSALASHLAGVAQVSGYTELVAYPATAVQAAQRVMVELGRTRMVPGGTTHLHTYLPEAATLGLGTVRQRLAG